jgi:hypothetical protein
MVLGHPGQIVCETTISKITRVKWTGRGASSSTVPALQVQSLKFKPQPHQNGKKEKGRRRKERTEGKQDIRLLQLLKTHKKKKVLLL